MNISRKLILENLKKAKPGIETGNAILQGSDAFVFHDGRIYTYNDSIAVSIPLEIEGIVDEGIEGAVHADEFFKIISKFSSDELNFVATDNGTWIIKCGRAKAEMTLMEFDFGERLKGITPDKKGWQKLPEDFMEALGCCRMTANKTPMSGIYFEGKKVVSTDGYRINVFEVSSDFPAFWVSDQSVNELMKFDNLVSYQIQGNWIHFSTENGIVFSIKTLNCEKFPKDKIFGAMDVSQPKEGDFSATFPKGLAEVIDRADAFAMDVSSHSAVRLVLSKKNIEVSAERSSGNYVEKIAWDEEITDDIEPITVYVDPVMMSFIFKRSLKFYLSQNQGKNGKVVPRLMFVTEKSRHLMSTFSAK